MPGQVAVAAAAVRGVAEVIRLDDERPPELPRPDDLLRAVRARRDATSAGSRTSEGRRRTSCRLAARTRRSRRCRRRRSVVPGWAKTIDGGSPPSARGAPRGGDDVESRARRSATAWQSSTRGGAASRSRRSNVRRRPAETPASRRARRSGDGPRRCAGGHEPRRGGERTSDPPHQYSSPLRRSCRSIASAISRSSSSSYAIPDAANSRAVEARRREPRDRVELVHHDLAVRLADEEVRARHALARRRDERSEGELARSLALRVATARAVGRRARSRPRRTSTSSRTSRRCSRRPGPATRRDGIGQVAEHTDLDLHPGDELLDHHLLVVAAGELDGGLELVLRAHLRDPDRRAHVRRLDEHRVAERVRDRVAEPQRDDGRRPGSRRRASAS